MGEEAKDCIQAREAKDSEQEAAVEAMMDQPITSVVLELKAALFCF